MLQGTSYSFLGLLDSSQLYAPKGVMKDNRLLLLLLQFLRHVLSLHSHNDERGMQQVFSFSSLPSPFALLCEGLQK